MSKHIEEAKGALEHSKGQPVDVLAYAQASALIAIAEQLQLANLIAVSESGRSTVNGARAAMDALYSGDDSEGSSKRHLKPEIADLLGIGGTSEGVSDV